MEEAEGEIGIFLGKFLGSDPHGLPSRESPFRDKNYTC